jgi:competence protein ComGC
LQSIMGAPLRSRSSFTCAAVMLVVVSVLILLFLL